MDSCKKHYKDLNLIRLIACISVLLYHFGILKGGYLAVCVFFVLSGYLSCISAFNKEKFSLLLYYKNRFKKLYLPLLVIVFITIAGLSFFSNNLWLNLKPETNSVLLGYNNFWQINANLDYFARHADSPFIHLWYIAILIQFDLIFPYIYLILKKAGDKISKAFPCILTALLSIIFSIYFYKVSFEQNIMMTYYGTFSRVFSLLFGVCLGFIHSYYGPRLFKNTKPLLAKVIFYFYLLALLSLFIFIDASSQWFAVSMILVSIISCRLIDYNTLTSNDNFSFFDKTVKFLSGISYEIYLLQYPIIYIFQFINMNKTVEFIIMTILILLFAYILNLSLNIKKEAKFKFIKITTLIIISFISLYGCYKYVIAEDHTEEMRQLEKQLEENEKMFLQKQSEYESQFKANKENWLAVINDLENGEKDLENVVSNLSIVGIGDSVMLGTVQNLYNTFPNGYFDAKTSRTAWAVNSILQDLKNKNILGDPVLLNLGANGDCPDTEKIRIMNTIGDRKVFWVNVTNNNSVNNKLVSLANQYKNLHIIDWKSFSNGHPEYFIADGIHLTETGKVVYTKLIHDSIYQVYLDEYLKKKQDIINQYEEETKNVISFYGNDVLLNVFSYIQEDYENASFTINSDMNYDMVKEKITDSIKNNSLSNKIVIGFDSTINFAKDEYQKLFELCSGSKVYVVSMTKESSEILSTLTNENVIVIDFYKQIISNKDYLMVDKIHLTDVGNKALSKILNEFLSN